MNNTFRFKSVSFPSGSRPALELRLHLVLPEQKPPYQRTKILRVGEATDLQLVKAPFFLIVQAYSGKRLLFRNFSQIDLRQGFVDFRDFLLHYELSKRDIHYDTNKHFYLTLEETRNTLSKYIEYQLQTLQQSTPVKNSLRSTHSIFYNFQCTPDLQIPYVALAGRGLGLLRGVTLEQVNNWQHFLIRELPQAMKQCGYSVAEFCRTPRRQLSSAQHFFVYDQIAKLFSYFVSSKLTYSTDSETTFQNDYVGFNIGPSREVYGDCEDGSQLLYDTIRIVRAIFPYTDADLNRGSSSFCYHLAYWLNEVDIWLLQGAVGDNEDTHVWCAMLPLAGGPAHYLESTGMPQNNFYKFVLRAWQVSPQQLYKDLFLVDPNTGQYGLGSSYLTHTNANGFAIFKNWAKPAKQDISKELEFVNLLDSPLLHPMDILSGNF